MRTGVLGDIKDLTGLTTQSGGAYLLVSSDGRQETHDARNRSRLPGTLASDGDDNRNLAGSASPGQPALVDAQFYARVTDNYYLTVHSFNWLDHYSQGIVSSAHVSRRYNNAYWDGSQMAYGDGDGKSFIEFSGDEEVVGHELSHGVTEATSNLIYQNESGALNEAFSDIMGTAIEFHHGSGNWTIGEDITVGSNGIRNMANPNEDGDPSHYADRYTGTGDNGGNGGGGGGTGEGPVIDNVEARSLNAKRGTFQITWTTDIPADSTVSFTCCGEFSDAALVTSHSMNFRGQKGQLYEFHVSSTSAEGLSSTAGPFQFQN